MSIVVHSNAGNCAIAEFEVDAPLVDVVANAKAAALSIPKATLLSETAESFHVSVGLSLSSWGEKLHVSAHRTSEKRTLIKVESRSKIGLTFADWGKNRKNVQMVIDKLDVH